VIIGLLSGGGLLGDVGGALGINTSKQEAAIGRAGAADKRARRAGVASIREAIPGIQEAGISAREQFLPFQEAGLGALPALETGATFGGFESNISEILSSGLFDDLISERQTAARGELGQAGLTRSGGGIQELAALPSETGLNLALQIEQLLSGRQRGLVGIGQTAAGDVAGSLTGEAESIANLQRDIANIQVGGGPAKSSAILGQAQAEQAGLTNIAKLLTGGLGAIGLGPGEIGAPAGPPSPGGGDDPITQLLGLMAS